MRLSTCAVVVLLAAVAAAAPPNDVAVDAFEAEVVQKLNSACANRETSACIKLKVITYMNRLLKKASIEVTEDVVLTQNVEAVPEIFVPTTPREIGAQDAFGLMAAKARNFIKSRELHWNVAPETDVVVSTDKDVSNINVRFAVDSGRAAETARHKIKSLFALGAAAIAKISVVAIVKFVALAVLVFKALIVSKLALAAAVILGVSRLLSHHGGGHSVTYEVVSHPHHTSVDHHESVGYSGGGGGGGGGGYSSGGGGGGGYSSGGSSYSSGGSSSGYARADLVSPYRAHAPARKPVA